MNLKKIKAFVEYKFDVLFFKYLNKFLYFFAFSFVPTHKNEN